MDKKRFQLNAQIEAEWFRFPCKIFKLKGHRLKSSDLHPMEYELVRDDRCVVVMVGAAERPRGQRKQVPEGVDFLNSECGLRGFARLHDQPDVSVVDWVSRWGLLGFRLVGERPPKVGGAWTVEQDGWETHGASCEPIESIRRASRIAATAMMLYDVLQEGTFSHRAKKIQQMLQMAPSYGKVFVSLEGVDLGEHDPAVTNFDWQRIAVASLGHLIDRHLSSEFQLRWVRAGRFSKLNPRWEMRSLLGALFLKLGSELRGKLRHCEVCGSLINHKRDGAKTCSNKCRKRKQRPEI